MSAQEIQQVEYERPLARVIHLPLAQPEPGLIGRTIMAARVHAWRRRHHHPAGCDCPRCD
jgi:hypothetical protein